MSDQPDEILTIDEVAAYLKAGKRTVYPQQLEAILATDGPVLIIAGPGSGKTFTLVERIVYLITQKGVVPESLLVVTFTDKAARELTTRISNRLAELNIQFNLNEMYLGTFHSICLRLLEDYREFTRLKRSFTLFDQFDQQYFLYQHIKDFRVLPDVQLVMGNDQTGRWAAVGEPAQMGQQGQRRGARRHRASGCPRAGNSCTGHLLCKVPGAAA